MPRKGKDPAAPAPTTAQALGSLVKSARDIMRKDKGLNGDLDRLPLLTWIMFLKFLDDLELQGEAEAALAGTRFRPAIEVPYRWRDWAASPQGITGDELLAYINQDETVRPDGSRGPGLFAYLRQLTSADGDDRREVIATVFRGVDNRMKSGYLLRDVINKIAGIHFTSSEELHTLGALYESLLREMRDAAGDSGEFYTPRPVVRFMVAVTDPRLGETVLDPASGTGGFLVEAFNHLAAQVRTVADRKVLQERSLAGSEPKPLPYLLCQMNLLLHGLDAPQIDPGNALRHKLSEIGEKERVDVILTNPPFGGEEEKGIQGNFPEDRQTAETALLFLQLIMRKLHRRPTGAGRAARAAVVVPNGTLFGDGVCARIKEELLKEFNLHTVVRLPNGVFAPYTSIPTNLLFFDRAGPTTDVWYYEHPLPEGRKNYTKTAPIQFEEFAACQAWWTQRAETERAWKVPQGSTNYAAIRPADVLGYEIPLPPLTEQRRVVARVAELERQIQRARTLRQQTEDQARMIWVDGAAKLLDRLADIHPVRALAEVVSPRGGGTPSKADPSYWSGAIPWITPKDMKVREIRNAVDHISTDAIEKSAAKLIDPGAVLVVVRGMILAHTVPSAVLRVPAAINQDMKALIPARGLAAEFLCAVFRAYNSRIVDLVERSTHDTRKLETVKLLNIKIPVPPINEQHCVVAELDVLQAEVDRLSLLHVESASELDALLPAILARAFRGEF